MFPSYRQTERSKLLYAYLYMSWTNGKMQLRYYLILCVFCLIEMGNLDVSVR